MVSLVTSITVTTTTTMWIRPDPNRTAICIADISATLPIYLGAEPTLNSTNGLPIPPGGFGFISKDYGDDPTLGYYLAVASGTAGCRIMYGYQNKPILVKLAEKEAF